MQEEVGGGEGGVGGGWGWGGGGCGGQMQTAHPESTLLIFEACRLGVEIALLLN